MNAPAGRTSPAPVAWLAAHEGWGVLALAPLLLFPTPAGVIGAGGGLLALRAAAWWATGHVVPPGTPVLPLLWLLGMAGVGLALSIDPAASLPRLAGLLLAMGTFYGAGRAVRPGPDGPPRSGAWGLVGGGAGLAVLMPLLVDWAAKAPAWLPPDVYAAWPGLFHNLVRDSLGRVQDGLQANTVAGLLALGLPPVLALACAAPRPGRPAPRLALAVAGLMGLALLGTESRGGVLAAAGAVVCFLAWRYPRARPALLAGTVLAGLAGLVALVQTQGATLAAAAAGAPIEPQSNTTVFRFALWDRALAMIADHPFTGVGLNNFPVVQAHLYPLFPTQPEALVIHAHNVYLQAALDYGLPGLCALLAFGGALVAVVAPGLRRAPGPPAAEAGWLAGCCAGLIAFALFGLADALAVGSRPAVLAWLLAGWAVGAAPTRDESRAPRPRLAPLPATLLWATISLTASTIAGML